MRRLESTSDFESESSSVFTLRRLLLFEPDDYCVEDGVAYKANGFSSYCFACCDFGCSFFTGVEGRLLRERVSAELFLWMV